MEVVIIDEVVGSKLVRLNLQVSLKSAVIGNGEVLALHEAQHLRSRNLVARGRIVRGGNVQRHGAVLSAPLLGVTRTLHMDGTALSRDEGGVHAVVLVTVRDGNLKGRGSRSVLVGYLRGSGGNGRVCGGGCVLG